METTHSPPPDANARAVAATSSGTADTANLAGRQRRDKATLHWLVRRSGQVGILILLSIVGYTWAVTVKMLRAPKPVKVEAKPQAIVWGSRVFEDREVLARWLHARGTNYRRWARMHPAGKSIIDPQRLPAGHPAASRHQTPVSGRGTHDQPPHPAKSPTLSARAGAALRAKEPRPGAAHLAAAAPKTTIPATTNRAPQTTERTTGSAVTATVTGRSPLNLLAAVAFGVASLLLLAALLVALR